MSPHASIDDPTHKATIHSRNSTISLISDQRTSLHQPAYGKPRPTTPYHELDDGSKLIAYLFLVSIFALVARAVGSDAEPEPVSTISGYLLVDCSLFVLVRLLVHVSRRLTSSYMSSLLAAAASVLLIIGVMVGYVGSNVGRRCPTASEQPEADPVPTLVYAATGLTLHIAALPLWSGRRHRDVTTDAKSERDFDLGVFRSTVLGRGSCCEFVVAFVAALLKCYCPWLRGVQLVCVVIFTLPMLTKLWTILAEVVRLVRLRKGDHGFGFGRGR